MTLSVCQIFTTLSLNSHPYQHSGISGKSGKSVSSFSPLPIAPPLVTIPEIRLAYHLPITYLSSNSHLTPHKLRIQTPTNLISIRNIREIRNLRPRPFSPSP